jgi:hypothetical protein
MGGICRPFSYHHDGSDDLLWKLDNLTTFIVAIAYRRAITSKKKNLKVETESVSELD